jgi:hypothetical protein
MNATSWLFSATVRLLFAGFLLFFGFLGAFMAGMSGDAGPNPVFYYVCLSVLLFCLSGFTILLSPSSFLLSGSRGARWLWIAFGFSIVQPIVVITIMMGLQRSAG